MSARSVCQRQPAPCRYQFPCARFPRHSDGLPTRHLDALAAESAAPNPPPCASRGEKATRFFEPAAQWTPPPGCRIQLRTVHFLNVDVHFAALVRFCTFLLQLVRSPRPLRPDDDARPARCKWRTNQLVRRARSMSIELMPRALQPFPSAPLRSFTVFVKKIGRRSLSAYHPRLPRFVVA